jgi:hypothetical protein
VHGAQLTHPDPETSGLRLSTLSAAGGKEGEEDNIAQWGNYHIQPPKKH